MCGPSGSEKSLANEQAGFAQTLQSDYNTQFANQANVLQELNNSLSPILNAGPNQQGFSASELAAMNTNAINQTGANYANAAKAVGGQLAGRGDSSGLESGVDQQIKGTLASQAAGTLSNTENAITQANYQTGRANYENAVAGANALAGDYNPTGFGNLGISGNNSAFGEANQVQTQKNQEQQAIAGSIAGVGMDALTGGLSSFAGAGDEGANQAIQDTDFGGFADLGGF